MVRARILYERLVTNFPTSGRYWRLYVEQEVKIAWSCISSLSIPMHELYIIDTYSRIVMVLKKFVSNQIPFSHTSIRVSHVCVCIDAIDTVSNCVHENSTAYGNASIQILSRIDIKQTYEDPSIFIKEGFINHDCYSKCFGTCINCVELTVLIHFQNGIDV